MKRKFTILTFALFQVFFTFAQDEEAISCPNVIAPVCGANGLTYINSCYAERDGVFEYTEGVCYDDCIDPDKIKPTTDCADNYEPVCGCNSVTYYNPCEAEKSGVTSYTPGVCSDTEICYDPIYLISRSNVLVTYHTGVISPDCPDSQEPVCGCNGITYQNPCAAETSGIVNYTYGPCDESCVDPQKMQPDLFCEQISEPVCGCNGQTYLNACEAEKAGVVSYTQGPCSAQTAWCDKAIPVQCGDFLVAESTTSDVNNINSYGCSNTTFAGPEKVYRINKNTAGDLQIGLEILTEGLDLDLFLMDGNCVTPRCLKKSTTDNSQANNEGVLLENAPIGTYYVVVDGQFENSKGDFRLEVTCGYLQCGDPVSIECETPYQGSNLNGEDQVSLYSCGNVINVENNGPEVVHSFAVAQDGPITIELKDLTENLELFLLNECGQGGCLDFSQNAGTQNEIIQTYLSAGTYYVIVDGYNGSVSDYTLTVDCSTSAVCNLEINSITVAPSACGASVGAFTIESIGGNPGFIVSWEGPVSGSISTSSDVNTVYNLPAGNYQVTKTDLNGCQATRSITIGSSANLSLSSLANDATCGNDGSIQIIVSNGKKPFKVSLTGPVNKSYTLNSNFFNVDELPAGAYQVYVVDQLGCSATKEVIVERGNSSLILDIEPIPSVCESFGAIVVEVQNGVAPYQVKLTGPVNGQTKIYSDKFRIVNLPGGTYQMSVTDQSGCTNNQTVVVPDLEMELETTVIKGICGNQGKIDLLFTKGEPPYKVTWNGPTSGEITTSSSNYQLDNLPSGAYKVSVMDNNWCSDTNPVLVENEAGGLSANLIPVSSECEVPGSIWIDVENGQAPYSINWYGEDSGNAVEQTKGFDIENLDAGTYTVIISDINGCQFQETVVIESSGSLGANVNFVDAGCGTNGSFELSIDNGTPDYFVEWDGPEDGSVSTDQQSIIITDLDPGTYSIQVTDAKGCVFNTVGQIGQNDGGVVVATLPVSGICAEDGAIQVDVSGGNPNYTISWDGPESGSVDNISTNYFITDLEGGIYTVTVQDALNCAVTRTVEVFTYETIPVDVQPLNGLCGDMGAASVFVGVPVEDGFQISWDGPVTGTALLSESVYQIADLPSGNYEVTISNGNACSEVQLFTITNFSGLQEASIIALDPDCDSNFGKIQVNITGGDAPYAISWSGPSSGNINTSTTSFVINSLSAGSYTVSVVDQNNCQITSTVEVKTRLVANVVEQSSICDNLGELQVIIDYGQSPFSVAWTGPVSGNTTTEAFNFDLVDLPAGNYNLSITDALGCTVQKTGTVVLADPFEIDWSSEPAVCNDGGNIAVKVLAGQAPFQITWTGPESGIKSFSNNLMVISDLPDGTYQVTLSDQNGCAQTVEVSVANVESVITINNINTINSICDLSGSVSFDINDGQPPFNIIWVGPESNGLNTSSTSINISNIQDGLYNLQVVDSRGCVGESSFLINNSPSDLGAIIAPQGDFCGENGSFQFAIQNGSPNYTIKWTGTTSGETQTAFDFVTIDNFPSGEYDFTIIDQRGCVYLESASIQNTDGMSNLSITPISGGCALSGGFEFDVVGGTPPYTLDWDGQASGSEDFDQLPFTLNNFGSGNYAFTLTDNNGCVVTGQSNLENNFTFSIVGQRATCDEPGKATIYVAGGKPPYTLSWSGPDSGQASFDDSSYLIATLTPGAYEMKLVDSEGCEGKNTIVIGSYDPVNWTATPNPVVCDRAGLILVQVNSGGTPPYQITWDGPVQGSDVVTNGLKAIPNLPAGVYQLTIIDGENCSSTKEITVDEVSSSLDVQAAVVQDDCGLYRNIWIDITGGENTYTIKWSGPNSGEGSSDDGGYEIYDLDPGDYEIIVTDRYGCEAIISVTIVPNELDLIYLDGQNGVCGELATIGVNISDAYPPYKIDWSGPSSGTKSTSNSTLVIDDLNPVTYIVEMTNAEGCSEADTISVIVSPSTVSIQTAVIVNNCGQYNTIWVDILNGNGPFEIKWTGPIVGTKQVDDLGFEIEHLIPGVYTVTVIDIDGCEVSETVTIQSFDLTLFSLDTERTDCATSNEIEINVDGSGTPPFQIEWTGPVNGSITINAFSYKLTDLPDGDYTLNLIDDNWCMDQASISLEYEATPLEISTAVIVNDCGYFNTIWLDILSGDGPFDVIWTGTTPGSESNVGNSLEIENLEPGQYTLTIIGQYGCQVTENISIYPSSNDWISLTGTPVVGNQLGTIDVEIVDGVAPFTVYWTGPNNGQGNTSDGNFTIVDLNPGTYEVEVVDANGCSSKASIALTGSICNITANISPIDGNCTNPASIWIDIIGGSGPYTISWSGPESGSQQVNGTEFDIKPLTTGDYNISVTDQNGCLVSDAQSVQQIIDEVTADFNFELDGFTLKTTNLSTVGEYSWSFGDEETSNQAAPVHTYCEEGTFDICLTVDSPCGKDQVCKSVTLEIPGDMVALDVGEVTGATGSTIYVPIYVKNLSSIVSLAGSLSIFDESVGTILGLSAGKISPQFNSQDQTFNYYDNEGSGVVLSDGDVLFYLVVELIGEPGSQSKVVINEIPLRVEVGTLDDANQPITVDYVLLKGAIKVVATGQIFGRLSTFWGAPIQNATVEYMRGEEMVKEEVTGANGAFALEDIMVGDSIMVKPELDYEHDNGLSTFALFVGQRYILGMEPPQIKSPYQIIAGDANCNGSFTTLDLFLIQQLIIRNTDRFRDCDSWVFVSGDEEMPDPFNAYNVFPYNDYSIIEVEDLDTINFTGVKVGDILGQAIPNLTNSMVAEDRTPTEELILETPNMEGEKGEVIDVILTSQELDQLASLQIGLKFDPSVLTFLEIVDNPSIYLEKAQAGTRDLEDGKIRLSWFNAGGKGKVIDGKQPLLKVRFEVKRSFERIEDVFAFNDRVMTSRAHRSNGEGLAIALQVNERKAPQSSLSLGSVLHQNNPNPFINQTLIGFEIPVQDQVELLIYDSYGKLIDQRINTFEAGPGHWLLEEINWPSGLYYYTLKTSRFTATKSMVIQR